VSFEKVTLMQQDCSISSSGKASALYGNLPPSCYGKDWNGLEARDTVSSSACWWQMVQRRWRGTELGFRILYRAWRYRWKVERAEIDYLLHHVRRGETVVDIGAHKGAWTYWMQKAVGLTGHVVAFEPQPELAGYLAQACTTLHMPQVTVVPHAVSSRGGLVTLVRPQGQPSPSAAMARASWNREDSLQVKACTLDDYFHSHNRRPVRWIKCDVEGHELDVFRGAARVLREDHPVLLFECERRHHSEEPIESVFDWLQQQGYEGHFFSRWRGSLRPLADLGEEHLSDPNAWTYKRNFLFRKRSS